MDKKSQYHVSNYAKEPLYAKIHVETESTASHVKTTALHESLPCVLYPHVTFYMDNSSVYIALMSGSPDGLCYSVLRLTQADG